MKRSLGAYGSGPMPDQPKDMGGQPPMMQRRKIDAANSNNVAATLPPMGSSLSKDPGASINPGNSNNYLGAPQPAPDVAGGDLMQLLATLMPSAQQMMGHAAGQAPSQQMGQMMMRRRLQPSVTTTETFPQG